MHIGNEIKQGWDFSARIACTDIAAGLGNAYIGEVERAIEEAASRCAEEIEYIAESENKEEVEESVNIRRRRAR